MGMIFHRAPGAGAAEPLEAFCREAEAALTALGNDERCAAALEPALRRLVGREDWLGSAWRQSDPARYCQHPLYLDPLARFSVVSFVWGPGQSTPVHDHGVWGLVGVLRGAELSQAYATGEDGRLSAAGPARRLEAGETEVLLPSCGDVHRVTNASDAVSISIHVYGADIGRHQRRAFAADVVSRPFVSGYSATAPMLERSRAGL